MADETGESPEATPEATTRELDKAQFVTGCKFTIFGTEYDFDGDDDCTGDGTLRGESSAVPLDDMYVTGDQLLAILNSSQPTFTPAPADEADAGEPAPADGETTTV